MLWLLNYPYSVNGLVCWSVMKCPIRNQNLIDDNYLLHTCKQTAGGSRCVALDNARMAIGDELRKRDSTMYALLI